MLLYKKFIEYHEYMPWEVVESIKIMIKAKIISNFSQPCNLCKSFLNQGNVTALRDHLAGVAITWNLY